MATWVRNLAGDQKVPGSNPGTAEARTTSIKTAGSAIRMRNFVWGIKAGPIF